MKGQNLYLGLGILSLFLVFIFIHVKIRHGKECVIIQETYHPVPLYLRAVDDRGDQNVLVLQTTLMKQRNAMSKQMNEMSKQQGQKDCEVRCMNSIFVTPNKVLFHPKILIFSSFYIMSI